MPPSAFNGCGQLVENRPRAELDPAGAKRGSERRLRFDEIPPHRLWPAQTKCCAQLPLLPAARTILEYPVPAERDRQREALSWLPSESEDSCLCATKKTGGSIHHFARCSSSMARLASASTPFLRQRPDRRMQQIPCFAELRWLRKIGSGRLIRFEMLRLAEQPAELLA